MRYFSAMVLPRSLVMPAFLLAVLAAAGLFAWLFAPILAPFLAGALLAYIFDPLVDRLEARRIPRTWGTVLVIVLAGLAFAALVLVALPLVQGQFTALAARLPAALELVQTRLLPWLAQTFGIVIQADLSTLREALAEKLRENGAAWLPTLQSGALAVVGFLANLFLIPVVMFYLLRDWDRLIARAAALTPRPWLSTVTRVAKNMDAVVGEFLRGQLTVMLALTLYYTAALWLAGLDYALPIGVLTGLLSFVPFLGFGLGLALALVVALLQYGDLATLGLVLALYGAGQLLESYVLTPRLVGERVGLHPVAILFALAAFGQLMGFTGVLLAVPLAAVLLVALRELLAAYRQSPLYTGGYNPPPPPPPPTP